MYNSKVKPTLVEANLAKRLVKNDPSQIRGRVFWAGGPNGGDAVADNNVIDGVSKTSGEVNVYVSDGVSGQDSVKAESHASSACDVNRRITCHFAHVDCTQDNGVSQSITDTLSSAFYDKNSGTRLDPNLQSGNRISVNTYISESDLVCDKVKPIYDVNYCGFDDKFATSVMFFNQKGAKTDLNHINSPITSIFHLRRDQVDFHFGFVPLQPQVMPDPELQDSAFSGSLLEVHEIVKMTGKPNFYSLEFPFSPS